MWPTVEPHWCIRSATWQQAASGEPTLSIPGSSCRGLGSRLGHSAATRSSTGSNARPSSLRMESCVSEPLDRHGRSPRSGAVGEARKLVVAPRSSYPGDMGDRPILQERMRSAFAPGDVSFFNPRWICPPHFHGQPELLVIARGEIGMRIAGRSHRVAGPALIWLAPVVAHVLERASPDLRFWTMTFEPELLSEVVAVEPTRTAGTRDRKSVRVMDRAVRQSPRGVAGIRDRPPRWLAARRAVRAWLACTIFRGLRGGAH